MQRPSSLWSQLSGSARAELIPILSTAILVQAGETTAEALVRLRHWTPYGAKLPDDPAVQDITGMLLLVNFAVVLWFAHRSLKDAVQKGEAIASNAKLVGLGTAFLTCADLVTYGVKTGHPERSVYALLVILYVFVVPFFLIERMSAPASRAEFDYAPCPALHALGAITIVLAATLPAIVAILAGSLYKIALTDGVGSGPSLIRDVLHESARSELWGVSPGIVGLAWLPLIMCTCRWCDREHPDVVLGLRRGAAIALTLVSLACFIVMAEVLVSDTTLLLVDGSFKLDHGTLHLAKALLALVIAGAFAGAFFLCRIVVPGRAPSVASIAIFMAAGGALGAFISAVRMLQAHASPHWSALVLLHAGGFAVAYLSGRATLSVMQLKLPSLALFDARQSAISYK